MASLVRTLLIALAAALALQIGAHAQPAPFAVIVATDPGLNARLGEYEPFFVRLSYRTTQPVVLAVEGVARGVPVPSMNGGRHHASPGSGEVMLWVAFKPGVTIDALRVLILDERGRRISGSDQPARIEWVAGRVRSANERADWVVRMQAEQQRARPTAPANNAELAIGVGLMTVVPLAYVVLQALFGIAWTGRWRIAALLPLILIVPSILWSLLALSHQSNLWPITFLLLAPLGLIYLLIVWVARVAAMRLAS
jgi:hypothetical protein